MIITGIGRGSAASDVESVVAGFVYVRIEREFNAFIV